MNTFKKIIFLTGTRADFGKLKSLIKISQDSGEFEVHIFVTGMHLNNKYGKTIDEVYKSGFENIYPYINHDHTDFMDRNLAKTIDGFSHYVAELKPDLIIVHGDRVEALAGAIVGSLNNILVAHIEGGEVSGTIDELIRHAVSKVSHIHLVANEEAEKRLLQMGELQKSVHVIGSPDLDIMMSDKLAPLEEVKKYYEIEFNEFGILIFHPVTTEISEWEKHTEEVVDAVIKSNKNYIVIYPNNDLGSDYILKAYKKLEGNPRFKIFPSVRFEYFLTFLKHAEFIIGNSSVGIREAPYFGVATIDIGTRQNNRASFPSISHVTYSSEKIQDQINGVTRFEPLTLQHFGSGNSDKLFYELLKKASFWDTDRQKQFQEKV